MIDVKQGAAEIRVPSLEEGVSDLSVGDLLRRAARLAPDRIALKERAVGVEESRTWTYRQVLDESLAVAGGLAAQFARGDRVVVFAHNVAEWWFLEFGAALAGVVVVAANPASRAPELRHVLSDSDATGIVAMSTYRGEDIRALVREVTDDLSAVKHVYFIDELKDLKDHASGADLPAISPGDPFMIQYTSGTTGPPKGAVMRHRGVVNTSMFATERFALDEGSVWLNCMPMCHTGGSVHSTLGTLWNLGTMLMVPQFDAGFALELIEQEGANWVTTVPTMALRMLDHPQFAERDMATLRLHACGGAPVAPELVQRIERDMGCDFVMIYGQTEMSGMICQTHRHDSIEHVSQTVGCPLGPTEVRICPPGESTPVQYHEVGEIQYRSYGVFEGYWNNAKATTECLGEDGWFRTGDLGTIRSDGYLTITGRLKDMLIRGGENVYPREIEDQLIEHPAVAEVAVVGVPDPQWGEEIAAVVRLHPGQSLDQDDLRAFLRPRVSAHKIPRVWSFVEEFPATLSGKIRKHVVRDELLNQIHGGR